MVYTTWSPNFAPLQSKFTKFTNKSHSKMINALRNIAASKTMVCKWEFDIKHTHNCISIKDDPSYPQWKKKVSHISLKMFIHSHWRQATECGHTWYCWDHRHFIWLYVYHILIQELFMKYGCSICYQVIKKSNKNENLHKILKNLKISVWNILSTISLTIHRLGTVAETCVHHYTPEIKNNQTMYLSLIHI